MIAYKIVTKIDKQLHSCELFKEFGDVRYVIGKKVKPRKNCGPLCCFDSIESAKVFAHVHNLNLKYKSLYKCLVKRSKKITIFRIFDKNTTLECKEERFNTPKGTILCDEVTLLEKVKWGK